ncbi:MAG: hypothetical protein ACFFB5_19815 [Promethearchaeota archaeon]
MPEDKFNGQVTLYVSKVAKPVLIEKNCSEGHCHQPVVNRRLAQMTNNLEEEFYTTETQKIIIITKNYCEKHRIPLKIQDITGPGRRLKYMLSKRILRTPALEVNGMKEKLRLKSSPSISSKTITEFLDMLL